MLFRSINYRMEDVNRQLENGETVQPYSQEQAVLDPTLAPEEVPFKETPKEEVDEKEEIAAMGVPPKKPVFREVNVMGFFEALNRDGEAKLSDHYVDDMEESNVEKEAEKENENRSRGFRI